MVGARIYSVGKTVSGRAGNLPTVPTGSTWCAVSHSGSPLETNNTRSGMMACGSTVYMRHDAFSVKTISRYCNAT